MRTRLIDLPIGVALLIGVSVPFLSLAQGVAPRDLTQVSLEDLMNIQVTSVSKKEQKLAKAGAAIYVITQEDIRRSGATNIPDLLRMVPGVDVARVDQNSWSVSIRGFSDLYGRKLLVLIDGRSVYTPTFSGVFWDQQDVPLEDIERIEVIRGPGGTVWGANAVNGVINIMTKSAKATQGGLFSAGGGSQQTEGLAQYGGKLGTAGMYRAFGKYFNVDNSTLPLGGRAADGWHGYHGGFRSDWDLTPRDTLTVQGDILQANEGETVSTVFSKALPESGTFNNRVEYQAGNILGRWNHSFLNGSETSFQFYEDHLRRSEDGLNASLNTVDLDFSDHVAIGSRHDIVWGAGYRVTSDKILPGYAITFQPDHRTDNLYSTFLQDEIKVTNTLSLVLGSKFEHNAYTGFEYEPSAQLVWTPTSRHAVWASASRAIRQPSRADTGIRLDQSTFHLGGGAGFGVVQVSGSPHPKAEQLRDFEIGYRSQISTRLSVDITAFTSFYRHLETSEPGTPFFALSPGFPHLVVPVVFDFKAHAHNSGLETFANWNLTRAWKISPGYSFLSMNVLRDPSSQDTQIERASGSSPRHQFQIHSLANLRRNLDWDSSLTYVGGLAKGNIPGYARVDTRIGWRFGESGEISIVGQNLLSPRHAEFSDGAIVGHTLIERSVFAKVTWRF
jgi:iron complex outermembrane receptor protein